MMICSRQLYVPAAQIIIASTATGEQWHAAKCAIAGADIAMPVSNTQMAPANPRNDKSQTTGTAPENRNGSTPEISGQRGMIGRPRRSISIGLPVRCDFSNAR